MNDYERGRHDALCDLSAAIQDASNRAKIAILNTWISILNALKTSSKEKKDDWLRSILIEGVITMGAENLILHELREINKNLSKILNRL